jgi:hypothetical protein
VIRHWCHLAAETGAYVSVPSRVKNWRSLTLRHKRPPFTIRVTITAGTHGRSHIELSSSFILGARSPSFSLTRSECSEHAINLAGFAVHGEATELPDVLRTAEDELVAAGDHIDWLQIHDRCIEVRTNLGPMADVDALDSCLDLIYALAGDDQRGIEAMRRLPATSVHLEAQDDHGEYPRVVVAVPTPVELSIRTDHDAPRTVACAEASRESADFSCDIGADGRVTGRPAKLIDESLHDMLPTLALCRLRKRGDRVELVWPRVESNTQALMAGARLLASFRHASGPYR